MWDFITHLWISHIPVLPLQTGKETPDPCHAFIMQVRYKETSQSVLQAVRRLAGNNAVPALSLLEYDASVESAMKFVFEGTLICKVPNHHGSDGGPFAVHPLHLTCSKFGSRVPLPPS